MKFISIFLIIFLITYSNIKAQNTAFTSNVRYYTLGTLHDYRGCYFNKKENEKILSYGDEQYYELYIIDSLLNIHNNNINDKIKYYLAEDHLYYDYCPNEAKHYGLYSLQLHDFCKSFYSFCNLRLYRINNEFKIGKLRYCPIKSASDVEINSFLAGAFQLFGSISDENYKITLYNSTSKAKIIYKLLKKMNCEELEYKILNKGVPWIYIITFKPNQELKEIFDNEVKVRNELMQIDSQLMIVKLKI